MLRRASTAGGPHERHRPRASQFAYDRVAYPAYVVEGLAPNRLRAAALLHGWRAPDPLNASVLEIGCGEGMNLMPSLRFRRTPARSASTFRPRRSSAAAAWSRHAGSTNVDLHVGDALTYPRDGEKFDYIICHGVLSWVPEPVRRRDHRAHRRAARARRPRPMSASTAFLAPPPRELSRRSSADGLAMSRTRSRR